MFEKSKSFLYRIVFMILFIVLAKTCVSDYIHGGDEYKISELEQMISENTVVTASLSNEYTESTVASVVKLYKFDYRFDLNGKSYTGKITLNAVPNTSKLNIYYLSDDPNIIAADPYEAIAREKEKGSSISELLIGIVWGVLAIILLISLMATIKSTKTPEDLNSETKTAAKSIKTRTKKKAAATVPEITPEEERIRALEKERIRTEKEDPTRFMPRIVAPVKEQNANNNLAEDKNYSRQQEVNKNIEFYHSIGLHFNKKITLDHLQKNWNWIDWEMDSLDGKDFKYFFFLLSGTFITINPQEAFSYELLSKNIWYFDYERDEDVKYGDFTTRMNQIANDKYPFEKVENIIEPPYGVKFQYKNDKYTWMFKHNRDWTDEKFFSQFLYLTKSETNNNKKFYVLPEGQGGVIVFLEPNKIQKLEAFLEIKEGTFELLR